MGRRTNEKAMGFVLGRRHYGVDDFGARGVVFLVM